MWQIDYFYLDSGRCPTQEFLDGLNQITELPFVMNAIKQLEEFGNLLQYPQSSPLEDKLLELRISVVRKRFRFIYFFEKNKIIIITHGFGKKVQKTPRSEIERAKNYRNIHISRGTK
jgi:phage-related protein